MSSGGRALIPAKIINLFNNYIFSCDETRSVPTDGPNLRQMAVGHATATSRIQTAPDDLNVGSGPGMIVRIRPRLPEGPPNAPAHHHHGRSDTGFVDPAIARECRRRAGQTQGRPPTRWPHPRADESDPPAGRNPGHL